MSNKFWDQHSIKGKTSAAHDHVYGAHKAAATSSDTDDTPNPKSSSSATPPNVPNAMSYGGGHNDDMSHPGFKAVQGKIEKEGYSPAVAGAILASKTRGASAAAKKANPNLKKVKG
jgi:hypothetical protein